MQTGLSTLSPQTMLKYATCFICAAHAAAAPETCSTMGAPWFGASPTATPLTLHRRGWGACALCGGAERRRERDLLGSREVLALEHDDTVGPHRIQDLGRLLARECCGVDVVDDGAEPLGTTTKRAGAPAAAVEG